MKRSGHESESRPDRNRTYRPCVGIALFNREGQVFLGHRRGLGDDESGHAWQMPQGGIDAGESPLAAALRELREETNVPAASATLLGQTDGWLCYDLPVHLLKRAWKGRYRGQAQKWFAFGFTGHEAQIDVARPGGGAHPAEFDAWRWEALDRTPELIVPFKRPVYERVAAAFAGFTSWQASP